MDKYCKRI
nr:unnamed protein product [Callosobruchus analis]